MARGTTPLALPLIRWREVGQFYFGDRSTKWVTIQPALTPGHVSAVKSSKTQMDNAGFQFCAIVFRRFNPGIYPMKAALAQSDSG